MLQAAELVQRKARAYTRVVAPHHRHDALRIQRPHMQSCGGVLQSGDAKIDLAAFHLLCHHLQVERPHLQPHPRGFALEVIHQLRQQRIFDVVGSRQGEGVLCIGRIKCRARLDHGADLVQHLSYRARQHAARAAQQYGIAEQLAQAREQGARRGLRQTQAHRGARHAALIQQRVQRDQQVEIDVSYIHKTDMLNLNNRLYKY